VEACRERFGAESTVLLNNAGQRVHVPSSSSATTTGGTSTYT